MDSHIWAAIGLTAYKTYRYGGRMYVALLLAGLAFSAYWLWVVYDANLLQYGR